MLEGRKACSLHLQRRSLRRLAHRRHRHPQRGRTVALGEDVRICERKKDFELTFVTSRLPGAVNCYL